MTLRTCERWLTVASWVASIVHLVWFYLHELRDAPSAWSAARTCMDVGYWWQFAKTPAGAITGIAAVVLAVAQSAVMIVRMRREHAGG